jgi:hypothetical protein
LNCIRTEFRPAFNQCDLGVADELHADDFQLITPGGDSLSKREYLQAVASGDVDKLVWELEEIESLVHEDSACLRLALDDQDRRR